MGTQNEILINATPGETRVALLEKKQFRRAPTLERAHNRSIEGAVVKGRVSRVLPGMQAAFVDIGLEKAAFLYAGDYVENIEELDDEESGGGRGRRRRSRHVPNIETLLNEGDEIVVQIAKEPIGTKGARITSHVSIAGSPPGPDALGDQGRRQPQDQLGQGATAASRHREESEAGRSRLHHSHGRRQRSGSRSGSRREISDLGLGRHPDQEGSGARAGHALSGAQTWRSG